MFFSNLVALTFKSSRNRPTLTLSGWPGPFVVGWWTSCQAGPCEISVPCKRSKGMVCCPSCARWSVIASAVIYISFLGLVWTLALPLRSDKQSGNSTQDVIIPLDEVIQEFPDHLEGVRLERDGDINTNFRQEIFLGEGEFERRKEENPKELLEDIFMRYPLTFASLFLSLLTFRNISLRLVCIFFFFKQSWY